VRGASAEGMAAGANYIKLVVRGVNPGFHRKTVPFGLYCLYQCSIIGRGFSK
jgi:hypothetical protein